jgi:serine/threonine protein kinase
MYNAYIEEVKNILIKNNSWDPNFTILPNSKNGGQSLCFFIRDKDGKSIMIAKFFDYLKGLDDVIRIIKINDFNNVDTYIDFLADSSIPYDVVKISEIIYYLKRSFTRYIEVTTKTADLFPKLITYDDNIKLNGTFYGLLVEEAVPGITLETKMSDIKMDGVDNVEIAIDVLYKIGLTIKKYTGYGFVHRDISPDNIILSNEKLIIIDPGTVKIINRDTTALGYVMGKINYVPPEQFYGRAVEANFSSDLYSLGIISYQLVTGINLLTKCLELNDSKPHDTILKNLDRNIEDNFFGFCDPDNQKNIILFSIIKKLLQPDKLLRFESIDSYMEAISIIKEV